VKTLVSNVYYYQDELGSTSHVASATGALIESYQYHVYGKPTYFSSTSQQLNSSTYGVKDLFTGQRWIVEVWHRTSILALSQRQETRNFFPDTSGFVLETISMQ
jgi:hypothetical protein